jgi:N-acetylmuramoyl-L-alanine amidase
LQNYSSKVFGDKDKTVSDDDRVKIANKYPDGIFISIHFNSGKLEENGIETYVMAPVGVPHPDRKVRQGDFRLMPGNASGSASLVLATAAHGRALLYLNSQNTGNNWSIEDSGVKRARYKLLTEIKIPSMRIEGGFLTNLDEAAKINSKAYQQALAAAIARAVDIYKKSTAKK